LVGITANAFYVAPINSNNAITLALGYDATNKEIVTTTGIGGGGQIIAFGSVINGDLTWTSLADDVYYTDITGLPSSINVGQQCLCSFVITDTVDLSPWIGYFADTKIVATYSLPGTIRVYCVKPITDSTNKYKLNLTYLVTSSQLNPN